MKILLILCFPLSMLLGQTPYIPFAQPNKFWFYGVNDGSDIPKSIEAFVVWTGKDTIINGITHVMVFSSGLKGHHPCQFPPCFTPDQPYIIPSGNLPIGFLREDTTERKVYYKSKSPDPNSCQEDEVLLYDFNVTVDSIPSCLKQKIGQYWNDHNYGSVDSIGFTTIYGKTRRTFHCTMPYLFNGLAFITDMPYYEGIGNLFYNPFSEFENTTFTGFCEGKPEDCHIFFSDNVSDFKPGDTWTYTGWIDGHCYDRPIEQIKIVKDTVVNNKIFSVLAIVKDSKIEEDSKILLFKKKNKISFYENNIEYLLYDFGLKINDTFNYHLPSNFELYVTGQNGNLYDGPVKQTFFVYALDSVLSKENKWIKRLHTEIPLPYPYENCINPFTLIEGIGSEDNILFGQSCWTVTTGCFGKLECFQSQDLNFSKQEVFCQPDLIKRTKYNLNDRWLYTQWALTPEDKIHSVRVTDKILIGNNICNVIQKYSQNQLVAQSTLIILYYDSLVQFYDGQKFKTLYDFRWKNIGDTVNYYFPVESSWYDISSSQGQFSPDTNQYQYVVKGIEMVESDEGKLIRKYQIENIYRDAACYNMGPYVLEGIGSTSGFLGAACTQLTSGFGGAFRCFKSESLHYNALDRDCEITSVDEVNDGALIIYPNPSVNTFEVLSHLAIAALSLFDLHGKPIKTSRGQLMSTEDVSPGLYILQIHLTQGPSIQRKVVVVK